MKLKPLNVPPALEARGLRVPEFMAGEDGICMNKSIAAGQEMEVKNSLATCGNAPLGVDFLTVVAPGGSLITGVFFLSICQRPFRLL
jgi:hypothetical protein